MAFARTVPQLPCPDWRHRHARVWGNGTYTSAGITFRRYACRPVGGKRHTFSVLLDGDGTPRRVGAYAPPPPCPRHPEAHHVRDGWHGGKLGPKRQRYRCYGNGKPRGHAYTPPLPRAYVEGHGFSDPCEVCEEPRGVHRGDQANARAHTWSSRTVAQGLIFLSRAQTYGDVGAWAYRSTGRAVARERTTDKPARMAEANRRWHVAADWAECFSPVFWEPLEASMKARALAERRRLDADLDAGRPLERPVVWVADELPIFGRTDALFSVLVVGEVEWSNRGEPHLRLRVARAMPDRTTESWALVFDELARVPGERDEIRPDFIVADGANAIRDAAMLRFGDRTRWVPSSWHLGNSVRSAKTGKTVGRNRLPDEALEGHLDKLARASDALRSLEGWRAWWDRLEVLLPGSWVRTQRAVYEPAFAAVIPLLGDARIPISNAGLEELIKSRIAPLFYKRTSFTSIERTNCLTDLAICATRFLLDDVGEVARRLRKDAHEHGGWAVPVREVGDNSDLDSGRRYRSLLDRTLTARLAAERLAA